MEEAAGEKKGRGRKGGAVWVGGKGRRRVSVRLPCERKRERDMSVAEQRGG